MSRNYHLRDLNIPVGGHLRSPKLFQRSEPAPPDSFNTIYTYIHYSRNIISVRTRTRRRRRRVIVIKASQKRVFTQYGGKPVWTAQYTYIYIRMCIRLFTFKEFTWETKKMKKPKPKLSSIVEVKR